MRCRILAVGLSLLIFVALAVGQVKLSLPDTTTFNGTSLAIPVLVGGFNNVGSFSLTIAFDKNVLTYTGVTNKPAFGVFNSTPPATANINGSVGLSWFSVSPALNIGSGKLLDLLFSFNGGTSSLTFANTIPSGVTDSHGNNLGASYSNGRIATRTVSYTGGTLDITAAFALDQNFPNPFSAGGGSAFSGNPTTAISFHLPALVPNGQPGLAGLSPLNTVKLIVYDALGREIATLVDGEKPPGSHTVIWNAKNLPSGVYIYRIVAGDHVDTKKMLLMK